LTPDRRGVPPTREIQTVLLIVDIVRSTALYEEVGNLRAREVVGACLAELTTIVEKVGGTVVKSMGDGLLCTFATGDQGVNAAIMMQEYSAAHELSLRAGVHAGAVIEENDDIFGDAVNTASRIADVAKAREILISGEILTTLPPYIRSLTHPVQPIHVKGKRGPIDLFSLVKGVDTGTLVVAPSQLAPQPPSIMTLTFGSECCSVGGDRLEITIGRDPSNDLIVRGQFTSRQHARVYARAGKFFLVDESANGTLLVPAGDREIRLNREQAILPASGRIYLGPRHDEAAGEPVEFHLEA
jgi:class 3 adenylate cyclase